MFKSQEKRFMTKCIDAKVPKEVQVVCWQLVDNLVREKVIEVDYLQIFELEKIQERKLLVTHRQEEPEYQNQYELKLEESIADFDVSKIWLIDDSENQTMLLPEEY